MDVVASTVRSYYDVLTEYEKARKDLPTSVAINAQRAEGGWLMIPTKTIKNKRNVTLKDSDYDRYLSSLEVMENLPTSVEINAKRAKEGWQDLPPSWKTSQASTHVWKH